MRSHHHSLVILSMLLSICGATMADIPQVISYQGKVTDTAGVPVPDGTYTMRFRIFNAATGGSQLWDSGAASVTLVGGVFSVLLGESPQPGISLQFTQDYWLLVTFAGIDQSPRQRLASTGYAYMASGLVPGTEVNASLSGFALAVSNSSTGADASAIYATSTALTGMTHGVYAATNSATGDGVFARNTSGTGSAYALFAQTLSTAGRAIYAQAPNAGGYSIGVHAVAASPSSDGIHGTASATTGPAYGGYFESNSSGGIGVYARTDAGSGDTYGVYAVSASPRGIGVYGATTGTSTIDTTYGGWFTNSTLAGAGVAGKTNGGLSVGVLGESAGAGGAGVYALSTDLANYGAGLVARTWSTGGVGVHSWASATTGTTWGGQFRTSSPSAGAGAYGWASATSGISHGVWGESWSTTPGAFGVYYTGGIGGTGTMTSVILTSQGPTGLGLHATAGDWVEDFGEARLSAGRTHVELDPIFLETVTIDGAHPMRVFVELGDDCSGVYVIKGTTGFEVVELGGGTSSARFDYRVLASRRGFEDNRLKICEAARNDSYLYPGLRAQRLHQLKEEQRLLAQEQAQSEPRSASRSIAPKH